jgi:glucokinase
MNIEQRLVADIGGSNMRVALYNPQNRQWSEQQTLVCEKYPGPQQPLSDYLDKLTINCPPKVCLAMAAIPSGGDQVAMTNLPWRFSQRELKQHLGCEQLAIINDFDAIGLSLPHLASSQLLELQANSGAVNKHLLAIGPGTGLGGCVLTEGGEVLPCEPGHVGLSPATKLEFEIFQRLLMDVDEVYAELLLSGPGLERLYLCLADILDHEAIINGAENITEAAIAGDELALKSVNVFCDLLGSAAGDFATSTGALGGIYLAGGILPRMIKLLERSDFLTRLTQKNAQRSNLEKLPVAVITEPQPGLLGAAHYRFY